MSIEDLLNLLKKLPKFVKDFWLAILHYFLLWGTEDSDLSGEEEVREFCGNVHVRELVDLCRDDADLPTVRVHRKAFFTIPIVWRDVGMAVSETRCRDGKLQARQVIQKLCQ